MTPQSLFIHMYCRSGGTLFTKHLRTFPNSVVLSEVSPYGCGSGENGSPVTLNMQLKDWYGIPTVEGDFFQQMAHAARYCRDHSMNLTIRSWSYIYFVTPHGPQLYEDTMSKLSDGMDLTHVAFYRNPIDIWLSMCQPPLDNFCSRFGNFVRSSLAYNPHIIRYEDFCRAPHEYLTQVVDRWPYPATDVKLAGTDTIRVTGDVQTVSRGGHSFQPLQLIRRWLPQRTRQQLSGHEEFRNICSQLGYSANYDSEPHEQWHQYLLRRIWLKVRAISKNASKSSESNPPVSSAEQPQIEYSSTAP